MSSDITHKFHNEKYCWFCGSTRNLHLHHIFYGTANRKISDREGFVAYLCYEHHEGNQGVHHNRDNDLILKRECEKWYLKNHTKQEFIKLIGRNYIG